jgi:DNA polymerase (family 10)
MAIHNIEIAAMFNQLADLLEIEGANPFRVRAYRNAAITINGLSREVSQFIQQDNSLTILPGIGKDLAEKIKLIVETGKFPLLQEVEARFPLVLSELLKIEGLGPKRVKVLYQELGIRSTNDLRRAIESQKLRALHGFGEKTETKILIGLERIQTYFQRLKLADASSIVDGIITYLKQAKGVKRVECVGSFRRRKDTIGDLDFLVIAENGKKIIQHFIAFDEVAEIISQGTTRSTVRLHSGIQVDLRVLGAASYGAALIYFTGSKSHNIAIRKIAVRKKYKINEYGIFKGSKQIAGNSEKEIYQRIGLDYIEPEMREDRGEIELAMQHKLPRLINLKNIRGDLHCHTKATDGNASIEQMADKAAQLGYEYIAITDHSHHLAMVHGFDSKKLLAQIKFIDKLNAKLKNIVILKSIEVDILEDGTLDLPNTVLKELDFTVGAIHYKFNLSPKKQTERIIRAMDNPYFNILAHPTGRLINKREPYVIDLERIMQAAKDRACILELNAQPERMDLNDLHCKMAKEMQVKLAISTDSHSLSQMEWMKFGVDQARRGWLEAKDVVNTYDLSKLKKLLNRNS